MRGAESLGKPLTHGGAGVALCRENRGSYPQQPVFARETISIREGVRIHEVGYCNLRSEFQKSLILYKTSQSRMATGFLLI